MTWQTQTAPDSLLFGGDEISTAKHQSGMYDTKCSLGCQAAEVFGPSNGQKPVIKNLFFVT